VRPLPFVWPYALVFWAVYIWAFLPEWKIVQGGIEGAKGPDSKDSGSMRVLLGECGSRSFWPFHWRSSSVVVSVRSAVADLCGWSIHADPRQPAQTLLFRTLGSISLET